jgi:hypothetical protein
MADTRAGGRSGGFGTVGDRLDCAIRSGGLSAYARSAAAGFDPLQTYSAWGSDRPERGIPAGSKPDLRERPTSGTGLLTTTRA